MKRRVLGNLVALAGGLLVALLVGEAALRVAVTLPLPRLQPEVKYDSHPVRRFTIKPNQRAYTYGAPATIDERGFRLNGASIAGQPTTVLAIGDSFTFGLGVRDDQTWPATLEAAVRRLGVSDFTVVNGGTISYGVFQELDLLRTWAARLKPEVVVHALYWNDFMSAEPPGPDAPSVVTPDGFFVWDQFDDNKSRVAKGASWAISHSALLFALRQAVAGLGRSGGSEYQRSYARMLQRGLTAEEWEPIESFYRELLTLSRAEEFSVFVIVMPVNGILAQPRGGVHPYAVQARERLTALGLGYLDAFQMWQDGDLGVRHFLPQGADAHLDADGYQKIGEAVGSRLKALRSR